MDHSEIISTLNHLIETSKDGEGCFRTCAEDASDQQLKTLCADRAQSCATASRELLDLVRAHGGKSEAGGGMAGVLHRRWVDIKSAMNGKDDEAIANECELGEDVALRAYREALETELPPGVRTVVERQAQGVSQNHDQIKRLRDQLRTPH